MSTKINSHIRKIGIFTKRPINPLHPRLLAIKSILEKKDYKVNFIIDQRNEKSLLARINWLSLWFFDFYGIAYLKKYLAQYDLVIITDLKYLPLVKIAKKRTCRVIYETLDNNVHLRFYQLRKRFNIFKKFKKSIITRMVWLEKKYAFKYCDKVIVNSKALYDYFDHKATMLYYYSPLESIKGKNDSDREPALLYLGDFSEEKGAEETLRLQDKYGLPLFIIGNIRSSNTVELLKNKSSVTYYSKMDVNSLMHLLKNILKEYYLLGVSLIKSLHYSYETQEANKDIDYLSLGIPIIGNHRLPTAEKIYAGCGAFSEDQNRIIRFISEPEFRKKISSNAIAFYQKYYRSQLFDKGLLDLVRSLNY